MKQSGRTETSITTIKAAVKNTENRTGENNVTFELKKKHVGFPYFCHGALLSLKPGTCMGSLQGELIPRDNSEDKLPSVS